MISLFIFLLTYGVQFHGKIFQNHIIGKWNGNLLIPIKKSISGKTKFFPLMGNLPFNINGYLKISMMVSL